jgi:hypothetical protein
MMLKLRTKVRRRNPKRRRPRLWLNKSGNGKPSTKSRPSGWERRVKSVKKNTTVSTRLSLRTTRTHLPTHILLLKVKLNSSQFFSSQARLHTISSKTTTEDQLPSSSTLEESWSLKNSKNLCPDISTSLRVL